MHARRLALVLLLVLTGCRHGTPDAAPSPSASTAVPSAPPSAKPTKKPKPTPKPTAKPTPTATTPAIPPATGPAPAHFRPIDFSFVGANVGWALGEVCAGTTCVARVAYTTDSGRSWHGLPPPVNLKTSQDSGTAVRQMRFGNLKNGYLFDPSLFSTHDGGRTWHQVTLSGDVVALNETKGTAWAVVRDCGASPCTLSVWVSPMDRDAFAKRATLDLAGRLGGEYELVRSGPNDGWLSAVAEGGAIVRTTDAGHHWQVTADPCDGFELSLRTQQLTVAFGRTLWIACGQDAGAGAQDKVVFHSTDGAASWHTRRDPPRRGLLADLVATGSQAALLATSHSGLLRTADGGGTWNVVAPDCCDAGFGKIETIDNTHVWAIGIGRNAIFRSGDGGRHWDSFAFTE